MTVVIDASVAIKWVVSESGSERAADLAAKGGLVAPDLIFPECANILWKKVGRNELTTDEAALSARAIAEAPLEIVPTRPLLPAATELALRLNHAAYDCFYLALAIAREAAFITADEKLVRKIRDAPSRFDAPVLSIREWAGDAPQ